MSIENLVAEKMKKLIEKRSKYAVECPECGSTDFIINYEYSCSNKVLGHHKISCKCGHFIRVSEVDSPYTEERALAYFAVGHSMICRNTLKEMFTKITGVEAPECFKGIW